VFLLVIYIYMDTVLKKTKLMLRVKEIVGISYCFQETIKLIIIHIKIVIVRMMNHR